MRNLFPRDLQAIPMDKDFLHIDGVLVDPDIARARFVCDLDQCKGACCTLRGERGAPLFKHEIEELEKALPIVMEYLPGDHVHTIEVEGFWEARSGAYTRCINSGDCVFVYYKGDIAQCGIERAYREGKIGFIKPLSCHLFPIKISILEGRVLRFEHYSECKAAIIKGRSENALLVDFCRDALQRAFGEEWVGKMRKALEG